jgi:hypothetical protein
LSTGQSVPSPVRKALVRHGLEQRRAGNPRGRAPLELELSDAELRARHAGGESISALAQELGVARATIRKHLSV